MVLLPAHWPLIKLPDVGVACRRIEPQHIAGAVLVEVADAGDLIAGRVQTDRAAAGPLAVVKLQMSVSRVVGLNQSTSLVPSLLKSPIGDG